jgi:hypothetical protein
MAAARLAMAAAAPFVFAMAMEQIGIGLSLFAIAALGTVGMAAFVSVSMATRQNPVTVG